MTRPGITLLAPGCASIWPTVAVTPARSTARMNSAAAQRASRRRSIGVVPAWFARPVNSRRARVCPAIPLTTPRARPRASSTGPCSM